MDNLFLQYVSNTSGGTSNNTYISIGTETGKDEEFRIWFRPQRYGEFRYRFWFSNTVDSTFDDGSYSRANLEGDDYTIKSAFIGRGKSLSDGAIFDETPITFSQSITKEVRAGEKFWSDEVIFEIPQNEFLVFTWTISAKSENAKIPCTPDSQLPCFMLQDGEFVGISDCPIPNFISVFDETTKKLGFIGDSITQGCGTTPFEYGFWVAKISQGLLGKAAVWNLGLGYGRGFDAATDGAWLYKARQCDDVAVCFGVNDIISGKSTADEILRSLKTIISALKKSDCRVILFTIPTFDFEGEERKEWSRANEIILQNNLGADFVFDVAAVVSQEKPHENLAKYGPHPNDIGGTAIANAFLEWYNKLLY